MEEIVVQRTVGVEGAAEERPTRAKQRRRTNFIMVMCKKVK
jgi:hypothetical protein